MNLSFLLRGLLVGLAIAVPVGPTSILCINRALVEGFLSGFISALGAATSDALYGYIGIFGLTFITRLLFSQQLWIHLLGGIVLCYLGLNIFLARPTLSASAAESLPRISPKAHRLLNDYVSAFILTSVNPMTIVPFAAIFAGLQLENTEFIRVDRGVFILGIFLGAVIWGAFLSALFSWFGNQFNFYRLRLVNRISGVMIIAFGLIMLGNLITPHPSVLNSLDLI